MIFHDPRRDDREDVLLRRERQEEREKNRPRRLLMIRRAVAAVLVTSVLVLSATAVSAWDAPHTDIPEAAEPSPEGNTAHEVPAAAPVSQKTDAKDETSLWSSGGIAASPSPQPTPEPWKQSDDPLLILVNDKVAAPADWKSELVALAEDSEIFVDKRMYDDLNEMINAARLDDVWFWVASGYRSEELQKELLDRKINANIENGMTESEAEEAALRTIQKPGHSEHHLGLAIDFNDVTNDFESTPEYAWLSAHAAEYGFIQRYKHDKVDITGIDYESWHYRYVGRENAMEMERLGLCLEEYVDYHWKT